MHSNKTTSPSTNNFVTFPLHAVIFSETYQGGACACGDPACKNVGKHPAIRWGDIEESVPPRAEGQGTAIRTGAISNVFVVDVDSEDALEKLFALGHIPRTLTTKTPKGWHFFLQHPGFPVKNSASKIAPGVDIRGEKGFVVAPGSMHKSGKVYEVCDNSAVAEAPDWLLEELRRAPVRTLEEGTETTPTPCEGAELDRRIALAEKWLAEDAPPSIEGQGGHKAFWIVANKLIRHWELPRETAFALIQDVYNPRCVPVWSDVEIDHKLDGAQKQSTMPVGQVAPASWHDFVDNRMLAPMKSAPAREGKFRKQHDPKHTYSFEPGDPCAIKRKKTTLGELIEELWRAPEWEGVLQYDEFRCGIYAVDPPVKLQCEDLSSLGVTDTDILKIAVWIEGKMGFTAHKDMVWSAVICVAHRNAYHPIREYFESLPPVPKGPSIFKGIAKRLFGTDVEIADEFVEKWMVGGARRILFPGTQMDTMLVLSGTCQGEGKTQFCRLLQGNEFFLPNIPSLKDKDSSQNIRGKAVVEFGELDQLLRNDPETVKDYLTRTFDNYRPSYGRSSVSQPRTCIFIGTTNAVDFLRDPTGRERRYWPIEVIGKVDLEYFKEVRDRLWSEAYAKAMDPAYRHWFTAEEEAKAIEARAPFVQEGMHLEEIRKEIRGKEYVTTSRVYDKAIAKMDQGMVAKKTRADLMRVGVSLIQLGCVKTRIRLDEKDGKPTWVYMVPEALRVPTSKPTEGGGKVIPMKK